MTRNFTHHILLALLICTGLVARTAHAACFRKNTLIPTMTIDISMGRISVPPNVEVGREIAYRYFPMNLFLGYYGCIPPGGTEYLRYANGRMPESSPIGDIYMTDVPGVAVWIVTIDAAHVLLHPYGVDIFYSGRGSQPVGESMVYVAYIKTTDEVGAGSVFPAGLVASNWLDGEGESNPMVRLISSGEGTVITPTTCSVQANSSNIAVNFGAVSRTDFSGVGSRAVSRDFAIDLDCSSVSNIYNSVGVRIDASQDTSNLPGVLALTATDDAAKGVGIELVRLDGGGEQPLHFAEAIDVGRVAATTTHVSLPLRARYIQTEAGAVTPGKANGIATFTIQYK